MSSQMETGCVLRARNCGFVVTVEDDRIVKIIPDKDSPRSEGYCCRKGLKIAHCRHHADRMV